MRALGLARIREHDVAQARYLVSALREIPGVRVLASDVPAEKRIALATFVLSRGAAARRRELATTRPMQYWRRVSRQTRTMAAIGASPGLH